ncbi:YMGG-like Gly-zipper [Cnuella takakiae]|uniref:YMGG-like Gly-zipper n=1 Tax=Cnuella takakiae TaxID=1302690 RepID=A0A1M5EIY6_9BACT|nr:YMGG-like glycine zipper-containing protein [Cnuella takakiae]OLY91190.1 hypothetical protein BUE76_04210 [Cnuella takakiae]SHF79100.1 YMGG-like Gly-zipper [Cnuella takakiae]
MKKILSVVTIAAFMASCTSSPNNSAVTAVPQTAPVVDTTGLAQFQAFKRQQELMRINEQNIPEEVAPAAVAAAPAAAAVAKAPARRSTSSGASRTRSTSPAYEEGSMSSTSGNTAKAKKGWSKAAKGTAIGAGSGAVLGAVINKKNRAVGGVIGGVAGGAIGYGIGRSQDKKDGRY